MSIINSYGHHASLIQIIFNNSNPKVTGYVMELEIAYSQLTKPTAQVSITAIVLCVHINKSDLID